MCVEHVFNELHSFKPFKFYWIKQIYTHLWDDGCKKSSFELAAVMNAANVRQLY